jgi:hypothetical protein
MTSLRNFLAIAALSALPLLSGCVAAAIPVLAAGGIVRTQADNDAPKDTRPRVALPAEDPVLAEPVNSVVGPTGEPAGSAPGFIVRDYTLSDGTEVTVTNSFNMARPSAPPEGPSPAPALKAEGSEVTYLPGVTNLPAPSIAAPPATTSVAGSAYADFAAFAREQASAPVVGGERRSALLADSGQLAPETSACSIHPAAVIIDLDPAGKTFETAAPLTAAPALAASLAQLRIEGVEIGWVSGSTADRAGAIRKALTATGLDPDGRDQLVLLRFPDERKQTRREDFAKAHCVLAIAGDEKADFDELFSYLRDPNMATPLDALIGNGWFLVSPPLN